MGQPKKFRKKYSGPSHPWQKERIDEEKAFSKEFGLKNKKEIWKFTSLLSNFKRQAKKYSAVQNEQTEKEAKQLMKRLQSYGLVKDNATFDDVLGLHVQDLLKRRLQSILVAKKLARTIKQARQMITHQHVSIGDKTISSPSYLVKIDEEPLVQFNVQSSFIDESHPERVREKEEEEIKAENAEAAKEHDQTAEEVPSESAEKVSAGVSPEKKTAEVKE